MADTWNFLDRLACKMDGRKIAVGLLIWIAFAAFWITSWTAFGMAPDWMTSLSVVQQNWLYTGLALFPFWLVIAGTFLLLAAVSLYYVGFTLLIYLSPRK